MVWSCNRQKILAKLGLRVEIDGKRAKGQAIERWLDTLATRLHFDQAYGRENGPINPGELTR